MRRHHPVAIGLLALLAYLAWRYLKRGVPITLPICGWRFVSNGHAWNVALPDLNSVYHVMLLSLDEGEVVKISANSLPYVRYMSVQSYSIPDFVPRASLRDYEIIPNQGANLFSNLTAAKGGTLQGDYTIHVTAHGDQGLLNEMRGLMEGRNSGFLTLFMRLYVPERRPPEGLDLSCFDQGGWASDEKPEDWGWACPPVVSVRRRDSSRFVELPLCSYRRKRALKIYNDVREPKGHCQGTANEDNSFFLPDPRQLSGKFANKDATYLFSCANASRPAVGELELWARVNGTLPSTPAGLTLAPFVADRAMYDIRYVSLSSVSWSVPYPAYRTLYDWEIRAHYTRQGRAWDGRYTVWFGPPGLETRTPAFVEEEGALFLPWGTSFRSHQQIPYPALLYRQILSRPQVGGEASLGERRGGGQHAYRARAVRSKMQAFYPSVRYFAGIDGGKELLSLHTDAVRALIDEEEEAGGGTEREDQV